MFTFPVGHMGQAGSTVTVSEPDDIFGSNLTGWYDSRTGITTIDGGDPVPVDQGDINNWLDQSGAGHNLTTQSASRRPMFVASGSDGTPEVLYGIEEGKTLFFSSPFLLGEETTAYIFMELPAANRIRSFLWSNAQEAFYVDAFDESNSRPGGFNVTWFQTTGDPVSGWTLFRFSAKASTNAIAISVNDDVEQNITHVWNPVSGGHTWSVMGRVSDSQALEGTIKQVLITDTIVSDSDQEHQDVLDWIANLYPTLVTY